jgi:hypothetical protein
MQSSLDRDQNWAVAVPVTTVTSRNKSLLQADTDSIDINQSCNNVTVKNSKGGHVHMRTGARTHAHDRAHAHALALLASQNLVTLLHGVVYLDSVGGNSVTSRCYNAVTLLQNAARLLCGKGWLLGKQSVSAAHHALIMCANMCDAGHHDALFRAQLPIKTIIAQGCGGSRRRANPPQGSDRLRGGVTLQGSQK